MFRRPSPVSFALFLVVLLLWMGLLSQSELRGLAGHHLKSAFVVPSRNYSFDSLDGLAISSPPTEIDRAYAIVRAINRNEEARPLLVHFSNDATVLAAYVLNNRALNSTTLKGPLFSPFPNWSVQTRSPLPPLLPGLPLPKPDPLHVEAAQLAQINELLTWIARGQQLEPQNTFWDWMQMAALMAAEREREIPAVLDQAQSKTVWNDHITDEMWAYAQWGHNERSYNVPTSKANAFVSVPLNHLSRIRNVSNMVAQLAIGLRLQGRDVEAFTVAKDALHLLHLIRLQGDNAMTSLSASSCELTIFAKSVISFRTPNPVKPQLSASTVARLPSSLLFLAHRLSPKDARELDAEWTHSQAWYNSLQTSLAGYYFSNIISPHTIENVGWTTRATSYVFASLPVAIFLWLLLSLYIRRFHSDDTPAPLLLCGVLMGFGLLTALMAFDFVVRAVALRESASCISNPSSCDTGYTIPAELLWPESSLLAVAWPLAGAVSLWLGMIAFIKAFAGTSFPQNTFNKARDTEPFHPLDGLWGATKWLWRKFGQLLARASPLLILALSLSILSCPAASQYPFYSPFNLILMALALATWPLAVGTRQVAVFARTRQRTNAPLRFLASWQSMLSGFILASLLFIPPLLLIQSHFEREFNREFAPIENGQMVAAIRHGRGLPME